MKTEQVHTHAHTNPTTTNLKVKNYSHPLRKALHKQLWVLLLAENAQRCEDTAADDGQIHPPTPEGVYILAGETVD